MFSYYLEGGTKIGEGSFGIVNKGRMNGQLGEFKGAWWRGWDGMAYTRAPVFLVVIFYVTGDPCGKSKKIMIKLINVKIFLLYSLLS